MTGGTPNYLFYSLVSVALYSSRSKKSTYVEKPSVTREIPFHKKSYLVHEREMKLS